MPQEYSSTMVAESAPTNLNASPPRKPANHHSKPASTSSDLHSRIIAQKREKARVANQEMETGSSSGRRGAGGGSRSSHQHPNPHHHHHHHHHSRSNYRGNQQDDNASISDAGNSTSNSARRSNHPTQSSSRLNSTTASPILNQEPPKAPKASLRAIQRGPGMEARRVIDPEAASVASGEASTSAAQRHDSHRGTGGKGNSHRIYNQDETESQTASGGRELFDPRKHDPISFQKRGGGGGGSIFPSGSTTSDARSYGASTSNTFATNSVTSASAPSVTSSDASRERRQRRRPGQSDNGSEGKASASKDGGANKEGSSRARGEGGETNSYVLEIKKTYREISALETKLQEENRTFVERGRGRGAGVAGKTLLAKDSTGSASSSSEIDHDFWLELAGKHKKLAETHVTFMELALRPGLPASLHSLPQTYNIPTRLWQTAFHTMLERLRHSLPLSQSNTVPTPALISQQTALLDHLTEFIYFAYSFYSNLHESELFRTFRSSWIESLGDLARYRMAVAGLSASLNAQVERMKGGKDPNKSKSERFARIDDDDEDQEQQDQERRVRGADEASIGLAALDDWDLEEKETWRVTARDWYATGLAEMPGTGRLHHHLGIMTRMLDELRALHHFCKSLTTSHPYLAARESILPLFDRELQLRRTQPEASVTDLFVHLHGMLFTRIQLDDFDDVFARFKERLSSSSDQPSELDGRVSPSRAGAGGLSQATWMMMATINIASLLQYGADNALLAPPSPPAPSAGNNESRSRRTDRVAAKVAPTAIMFNQASSTAPAPIAENGGDGSDEHSDGNEGDQAASKSATSGSTAKGDANIVSLSTNLDEDSMPEQLRYAIKLTFFLLEFVLPNSNSRSHFNEPKLLCPYLTMLLTFLTTVLKEPAALRLLEKFVPWKKLSGLSSLSPKDVQLVLPPPTKINAESPLPEDWSLRGMAWLGRRVYERGFWKRLSNAPAHLQFESEVDVLTRDMDPDPMEDGEDETASDADAGNNKDSHLQSRFPTLSCLRWKRTLFCISTLCAKHVPGLDLDPSSKTIVIVEPLKTKMQRWKEEEEQLVLTKRIERTKILDDDDEEVEKADDGLSESEDEEEVEDDEGDSEEVKELKARRRYLRGILRAAKTAVAPLSPIKTRAPGSLRKAGKPSRISVKAVPGYTILVLDTNILVGPGDLLQQLVESRKWTVVIPLAVITELDGLKQNGNDLAEAAIRSISYLEANIKSMSKWLKVQTSRGNYLSDLRIRREEIDFSGSSTDETQMARNLDEVILRAVSWQDSHFVDRLNLISDDPKLSRQQVKNDTPKAVLITLDRNLRLKAKIKGLTAFASQELTELLIVSSSAQKKKPV